MYSNLGSYKILSHCRFCRSKNLTNIIDLGLMPLAGAFIRDKSFKNEKMYPLNLLYCNDCSLVQVKEVISPDILFKNNYFFFSSSIKTLVDHFEEYSEYLFDRFLKNKNKKSNVLEIGCNDGVLLSPLSQYHLNVVGVDPAENVVQNIKSKKCHVENDYFTEKLSKKIFKKFGDFDLIISNFSFAHIDDMHDVMKGVVNLLSSDGVLAIEIYYLRNIIEEMNFDMIYHEHMSYYSLYSLNKFFNIYDMEVFDVLHNKKVRSGSTRFFVKFKKNLNLLISNSVDLNLKSEIRLKYNSKDIYFDYSNKIIQSKKNILKLLNKLKDNGEKIMGYGASGRGSIIMNYYGITSEYIDYVIDDAPQKENFYTPGNRVKIISWKSLKKERFPDYIILFAWSFSDEIIKKRKDFIDDGGKFIIPLPELKIYPN